jgi:peptidoglycan/xylan/chitin deacetylase (PgdA/CDA1 family)
MHKLLIKSALHALGLVDAARRYNRRGVRILMYHHFAADTRGLRRQCDHLQRCYEPVSLQEIADSYQGGKPLPANAVAVTVDDGYRDFLNGFAVFQEFQIPTTTFLVSDFVDCRMWLWTDMVSFAVGRTRHSSVTLNLEGQTRRLTLETPRARILASAEIARTLKRVENSQRLRALETIVGDLNVDLPALPPAEYAPLTWDDVRRLAESGVSFGVHTKTHPILSRVADPASLRTEILTPKTRIEAETGRPAVHFCYPNGGREDYTDAAVDIIRQGGFRTAVTAERGINFDDADPFRLRRLGVDPDVPLPYYRELLAGIRAQ